MTTYPVVDSVSGWQLAPDGPFAAAGYPQAVLALTLLDEVAGAPPDPPPIATTETMGLTPRVSVGGMAGLVGRPLSCFAPGFVVGAPLQLSLNGSGFLPVELNSTIGTEPGYPSAFTPVQLGTVALHRTPVVITGRTVSRTGVVRAGTAVTVDGIWVTLADMLSAPPAAPNWLTIASPLYASRDTTGTLAQQNLTQAPASEAKVLMQPSNVGDTTIQVSDQVGLSVGTIVALDAQDLGRAEYLAVTSIASLGPGANFPAALSLAFPLARQHVIGADVIRMIPAAPGPINALSRAASAGDVTLFPGSMSGLDVSMSAVAVAAGGAVTEYHAASVIAATSDAAGFVTLPPVHRVAQLRLRAHHPAEPTDLLRDVMLPFGTAAMKLDQVFP